jgi:ribose transport system permease protein
MPTDKDAIAQTGVSESEGDAGAQTGVSEEGSHQLGLGGPARLVAKDGWRGLMHRYGVLVALICIPVGFSIATPSTFFTTGNLQTILNTTSVIVFLTLGLTLALVVNEFDLSVSAVLGFTETLLTVLTVNDHVSLVIAVLACLAFGLFLGIAHAILVVKVGVSSFIVTLGSGTILLGVTLQISGSTSISGVSNTLVNAVSTPLVLGLCPAVAYTFALALLLWYVYDHTPLGRYMYFAGKARESARLSGLPVNALRAGSLIACSVVASVAGILEAGTLGGTDPTAGNDYLLPAFAGAFLGATMLKVGRFNPWGALLSVFLLQSGVTGLEFIGLSGWVEYVFNGAALVVAVTFATLLSRGGNQVSPST